MGQLRDQPFRELSRHYAYRCLPVELEAARFLPRISGLMRGIPWPAFLKGRRAKHMRGPPLLRCACLERLGVAALRRWTGKIAGPYGGRLVLAGL